MTRPAILLSLTPYENAWRVFRRLPSGAVRLLFAGDDYGLALVRALKAAREHGLGIVHAELLTEGGAA